MKINIFKEQKRRNSYIKIEKTTFIKEGLTFIKKNKLSNVIQCHSWNKLKKTQKGLKSKIHNRCIISGRPRSVLRKFKISRHMFRTKASYGLIPGIIKATY